MKKISVFLVDDETGALQALQAIIAEGAPEFEIAGSARNVEDAHRLVSALRPELLFLDIRLQDQTGFDLLRKGFDFEFEVIFVTAYDQYAIQAFRSSALSYLLKPVSFDDFEKAKQRAIKIIRSGKRDETSVSRVSEVFKKKIAIAQGSSIEYLDPEEIIYLKADGSYCEVHMTSGKKMISRPLKFLEQRIRSGRFVRAHRSYLVNAAFIRRWDKADGGSLILQNGENIPLSREGRKRVAELF